MAKQKVIAALDIGTEKICTIIASNNAEDVNVRVLGVATVPSKGLRKSQIVDLEDAVSAINESIDTAERMAGVSISSVYVSVGGAHIQSQNSKGVVAVAQPDNEIVQEDVDRVLEAAKAISLPSAREIIHVLPRDFKVDSQDGIKDPVGMSGVRLESEAHLITGSSTALRNIEKCLSEVGLDVENFVFSGLASAKAVLTETEKELGVVLLDIGAGSTSLCVFSEGSLKHSCVLPIGARHLTSDIALGLRMSLESAEKVKLALTKIGMTEATPLPGETREQLRDRRKKEDELNPQQLGVTEEIGMLSKKTIVEGILYPRLQEMFKLVGQEIEKQNLFTQVPAGIVLCGGGALTIGIVDVCKKVLNLPGRVGKASNLQGIAEDIGTPIYATCTGLLLSQHLTSYYMSQSEQSGGKTSGIRKITNLKNIPQQIVRFLRSLLP